MSALSVSFKMLSRQIKDDKIGIVMIGFPVLVALTLYFFAPVISESLSARYGMEWNLQRFYPLFDAMVVAFSFCTPGFASAMVMFSELDDKVVPSLCASPLGRNGYLFSRIGLPAITSVALASILSGTLHLADLPAPMYFTLVLVSSIACMLPGMIVIAFGRNKVEGVALFKMSIFTTFAILIPFFVESWAQWLFGFLPSFWIGKMVKELIYWYVVPALLTIIIWIVPLWKRFLKKL